MCVSSLVVDEIRRIVKSSEIMKEDDAKWPQKNKDGRQELEIRLGNDHISFEVSLCFPCSLFVILPRTYVEYHPLCDASTKNTTK